ncbi:MAG TPA: carbohydrate kinase family protein [Candidatus Saccharimonadales bacterium]|nr:carbohydrate kinase family protein [Candidatus Saccharimonadales bacterium]
MDEQGGQNQIPSMAPAVGQPVSSATATSTPSTVPALSPLNEAPTQLDQADLAHQSRPAITPLFDVMSIGDIVTDDFIDLLEDEAQVYTNEHGTWLAMPFGTKIPYDHHEVISAVGNASNAAIAFARLGLSSTFATNVGGDQEGRDMIAVLQKEGVDHRFVRINPDKKSNFHFVLRYDVERTILIKHEEYDYHWPSVSPVETPKWAYFSSISEHAIPYHDQVSDWLDANPSVKLAFQPGTFQMDAGTERLKRIYRRSEVLILNREEAVTVGGGNHDDINNLFDHLHALGPRLVVITDGPSGAYASNGQVRLKMPIYPDIAPPVERTGAGDAFASTFVASLIKGNTIEGALQWAPINSMSVCQKVGATAGLLHEPDIEDYLRKAPDSYKPERLQA